MVPTCRDVFTPYATNKIIIVRIKNGTGKTVTSPMTRNGNEGRAVHMDATWCVHSTYPSQINLYGTWWLIRFLNHPSWRRDSRMSYWNLSSKAIHRTKRNSETKISNPTGWWRSWIRFNHPSEMLKPTIYWNDMTKRYTQESYQIWMQNYGPRRKR